MSQATLRVPENVAAVGPGVPAARPVRPAAPGGGPAFPGLVYNGGPVIGCPQVYTSFWGSLWMTDPTHQARATRLNQFHQDLINSTFMNVLSQYGVTGGQGPSKGANFIRATFNPSVPDHLTDAVIQSTIQSMINSNALPEPGTPSLVALMIYVDDNNTGVDGPDSLSLCESGAKDFGYHYSFPTAAGHQFFYAVIPSLTNTCLTQVCGTSPNCSLQQSQTREQRQTQVATHEFAEMTTNPQWNPPSMAWYDPNNGEIGDICNGTGASITVGADTWNIQAVYNKTNDDTFNGLNICSSSNPTPLPELSPGPGAAAQANFAQAALSDRILPLPSMIFDEASGKASTHRGELREYVRRLFAPLHHSQVVGDLPALLREAADFLEGK